MFFLHRAQAPQYCGVGLVLSSRWIWMVDLQTLLTGYFERNFTCKNAISPLQIIFYVWYGSKFRTILMKINGEFLFRKELWSMINCHKITINTENSIYEIVMNCISNQIKISSIIFVWNHWCNEALFRFLLNYNRRKKSNMIYRKSLCIALGVLIGKWYPSKQKMKNDERLSLTL